jgi:hypothetical protein
VIRAVGVFAVFGAFWWLLAEALGGRLWQVMTDDPVAPVLWLLAALPFIMAACILVPERLRTVRLVDEMPVEVHNHLHLHQHLTVNHVDASTSQHLHLHGSDGAAAEVPRVASGGLAWRSGRELGAAPTRRALGAGQPRIVPGEVTRRELGR